MKDDICYIVFSWILQILVWLTLGLTIYFYVADISGKLGLLILFIVLYLLYLVIEYKSIVYSYLERVTTESGIYEKLAKFYRAHPVFEFYCDCYHYKTVTTRERNFKGRVRSVTRRVQVTTHSEKYTFPYYSERDVSGLFYLDCDKAFINRKCFIQLDISDEINFADAISCKDYEDAKDRFWRRNRFRDKHFYFRESRKIPGLETENLVRIGNNVPCCANTTAYLVFTFIPFAEFYKLYYYSICHTQNYKIRKIVSTRYDLNQTVYQNFIPQVDVISQQYNFPAADYNYLNNDYNLNIPSKEELEQAKKYQNNVPDYKISSGGGKIHAGVILDDPGYCSYNLNKPPEAFTSIAGDVALKDNQINPNGDLPPGFGTSGFKFNIANNEDPYYDDKPGEGYGTNTVQINNNNINQKNDDLQQIKASTERTNLKENPINNQQYSQQYQQQSQTPNYQYQQYPQQNQQQFPQQNQINFQQ